MNEDDEGQASAFTAMRISEAVIEYIDDCEEFGVTPSITDGDATYINASMIVGMVMETHSVAMECGSDDFANGATLITQCIMDLARTIYSRNSEVTIEDLFGSEYDG